MSWSQGSTILSQVWPIVVEELKDDKEFSRKFGSELFSLFVKYDMDFSDVIDFEPLLNEIISEAYDVELSGMDGVGQDKDTNIFESQCNEIAKNLNMRIEFYDDEGMGSCSLKSYLPDVGVMNVRIVKYYHDSYHFTAEISSADFEGEKLLARKCNADLKEGFTIDNFFKLVLKLISEVINRADDDWDQVFPFPTGMLSQEEHVQGLKMYPIILLEKNIGKNA
jgi:hypothetical protein